MGRIRVFLVLAGVTFFLSAQPVLAAFHLIKIVEVFPGSQAAPDAQYVVLQAYFGGQNFVAGHAIVVYDATGVQLGQFTFAGNVGNSADQMKILIATSQAVSFFGISADLTMTAVLPHAGGMVCFDPVSSPIDCVAYGAYRGPASHVGTPFGSPTAIVQGRALRRKLGANSILDDADDTNNSSMDFLVATPSPQNNSNQAGSPPASVCGNNALESLESCDDGNNAGGDQCRADCTWDAGAMAPLAIAVDDTAGPNRNGNGVLETGEIVPVSTTWRNTSLSSTNLRASAAVFSGAAGPSYSTPDRSAAFGVLPAGGSSSCTATANCYLLSVNGARPATHFDATLTEVLNNGSYHHVVGNETGFFKVWTLHIGGSFTDTPSSHPFFRHIETILHHGITGGCDATSYCPANSVTRTQMAIFLLRAQNGGDYSPPPAQGNVFADVPAEMLGAAFIEDLYNRGITSGCSTNPLRYCPNDTVSRAQMAIFLLRTRFGSMYSPPAAQGIFEDVPEESFVAPFIEDLAARGVTAGCQASPPRYCPADPITRGQMAVFLTRMFELNLYRP